MDKFEIHDLDNCFVCGEFMGPFKNELSVPTGFSERTIQQIIENFTETRISEVMLDKGGICQNCFIKFNEYDEHQTIANQIISELNSMLKIREAYITHKKDEIESVDILYSNEYEIKTVEVPIDYDAHRDLTILPLIKPSRSTHTRKSKDQGFIVTIINNQKFYTCEFCQKNYHSRSRLRIHRQIHTTERNFECLQCGARFKTQNCLKNHARLHSNVFFHCDLCEGRFKGKYELRTHMDAVHLGRKDHICQICGKAFSRDKTLRQHLTYHYNERNIVCEFCGYKAINKSKMARHLKSHNGDRNYACSICGKRFLYSYNVTAHVRHVHYHEKRPTTAEDKLLCTVCGKKFQKIWKVKKHMKEFHKIDESVELISVKNEEIE